MKLLVDERDVKFVLHEQLRIEELCKYPRYSSFSQDLFDMVLEEAGKLAEKEFYPANREGDRQGCRFEDGQVRVPEAFHQAYDRYREGGWLPISDPPEVGGQGFPVVLGHSCIEIFGAANWALLMYPGLTHGAGRLLEQYGTPEQQEQFMFKLFSGEWSGTMCLTEPQAGTDVGNLRTRATRLDDGTYKISGQKIFISAGMHDLSENIVHMVLARIDGAPKGVRGISIFIVPRLRYGEDGGLVDNDVACAGIEHKLGIHGCATCTLNFGEKGACIGYLLGKENTGMRIMFEMMNEARLFVGMQGLSHASTAYLHALAICQGTAAGSLGGTDEGSGSAAGTHYSPPRCAADADVYEEQHRGHAGAALPAAYCVDRVRAAPSEEERERFQGHVDLLIPICKAVGSDLGFRVCETAIQVYGGYGYISDYPVEQFLRDCKIASIYEGTNGIQALDLVGRKLTYKRGQLFKNGLAAMTEILEKIKKNFNLRDLVQIYEEAQESIIQVTKFFALKGMTDDFEVPLLYAKPYLDLCGDGAMGFLLLWQAHLADRRLQEIYRDHRAQDAKAQAEILATNRSAAFYFGKIASARFFINQVLTLTHGRARAIMNNDKSALEIPEHGFALG